jgi:hypothetical protein
MRWGTPGKGLTAVHEGAIGAVIPVKKAASSGQDDLFADPGGERSDGPAFGLGIPIDDAEWPRRQLLSTEREMLGRYVSAHPLDGADQRRRPGLHRDRAERTHRHQHRPAECRNDRPARPLGERAERAALRCRGAERLVAAGLQQGLAIRSLPRVYPQASSQHM